ncbi:MAG: hypothetical protein WCE75_01680 [Terracidiphilus sp.]
MTASGKRTAIYLVCFHSERPTSLDGTKGQFRKVETAIDNDEWPYDNGDDPSFYVARQGGPLTWGVCRQDLRNAIEKDSIVVFFSFTSRPNGDIAYRLCAVATVDDKVDHRAIHDDRRLRRFRNRYINRLITPEKGGWRYDESDRRPKQRHKDWLWRMADYRRATKQNFAEKHQRVYSDQWFAESAVASGELPLAGNYVVFSSRPDRTFISPEPPVVAIAEKGQREKWRNEKLRTLTVCKAASLRSDRRDFLRTGKNSGGYVHRQLRFDVPADAASSWRGALIKALMGAEGPKRHKTERVRTTRSAKC